MQLKFQFEHINEQATLRANELLDCLNEGRKGKQIYVPAWTLQRSDLIILCAVNHEGEMYNVIDSNGNTPKGYCADWRILYLIFHDIINN